jgi:hypothetical protein
MLAGTEAHRATAALRIKVAHPLHCQKVEEVSMLKRILKLLAPVALLALISAPALAQPSPPGLPGLQIRIAQSAPPRVRHERMPTRPDRESVWTKGYWHWEGSRWDWVSGRWQRPEQRTHRWIAPRYQREGNAWRYEPPHWSHQQVVEGDDYRRWKEEHHH